MCAWDAENDRHLIECIRAGDLAAFETMFRQHSAAVVRFASACVGDRDVAEDIMQDVFEWIWSHRATWHPAGALLPYLFTAVRNRARNRVRDQGRRAELSVQANPDTIPGIAPPTVSPDIVVEQEEYRAELWNILAELSEQQRMLLVLRWDYELGWDDIAQILGVSTEAVKKQHARLLMALRTRISLY